MLTKRWKKLINRFTYSFLSKINCELAAMVSCFLIVAPLTNTYNWLISWHSTIHCGFQLCWLLRAP